MGRDLNGFIVEQKDGSTIKHGVPEGVDFKDGLLTLPDNMTFKYAKKIKMPDV